MEQDKARQEAQARLEKARAEAEEARKKAADARARADANEDRVKKAREQLDKAREERKGGIGKAEEELNEAERPEKEARKAEKSASAKARAEHLSSLLAAESHQHGEGNGCVTQCLWDKALPPSWRRRCLFQGHNYRENGVNYQLANEADWYNLDFRNRNGEPRKRLNAQFSDAQLGVRKAVNNPTISKDCWWMSKYGANFRVGKRPWKNQAHHIIPTALLATYFGEKLILLQMAKYNIHAGVNIMLLPAQEKYSRIYELPTHFSSHSTYDEAVKSNLDKMKDKLRKDEEQEGGHPDSSELSMENWSKQLKQFSSRMRGRLRKLGAMRGMLGLPMHINNVFSTT